MASIIKEKMKSDTETVYFGNPTSIILNDKKALLKNYSIYLFGIPRFSILLNQKSFDLKTLDSLFFIDFEGDSDFIDSNFDLLIKANDNLPKKSEMIIISRMNQKLIEEKLKENLSSSFVEES